MSYSLIAEGIKATTGAAGVDVTTDAANTTGANLIVLVLTYYWGGSLATPTVLDSKGNTWTPRTNQQSGNQGVLIFYCVNPTVGPSHTFSSSGAYFSTLTYFAMGGAPANPFYSEAGATSGSATSIQPGSVTPPEPGCLIVTGLNFASGHGATIGSGFTAYSVDYNPGVSIAGGGARLIQGAAATVNPTWTWTSADEAAATIAVFRATAGAGDTTAPILTSPVGTTTGPTTATVGATTDEANGTLYAVVTTSATTPTAAQVRAGQNSAGAAATWAGSTAVGATGARTVGATGLVSSTAYYAHLMHEDSAGNRSNVVTSAQFTTSGGAVTILVTDGNWFFSPYNWYKLGATYAQTNNPGAYFKLGFTGTGAKLNVSVTPLTTAGVPAGNYPAILYSVDGGSFIRYQLTSTDSQLVLATGLAAGTHALEVHLVGADFNTDRWINPTSVLRVTGLELDSGATSGALTLRPNRILLYGDSNLEGYEALGVGATVANQNAVRAFPAQLGWAFDAEYGTVGYASQGYISAGGGNVPTLSSAWGLYHAGASRLSGGLFSPAPDWIFCHHGQNDGASVTATVTSLVASWRAAAPTARLVFCAGPAQSRASEIAAGVAAAADPRAYAFDTGFNFLIPAYGTAYHLLADYGHPRYASRVIKLAQALVAGGGFPPVGGGPVL